MKRLRDVLLERAGSFFQAQPSAAVSTETEATVNTTETTETRHSHAARKGISRDDPTEHEQHERRERRSRSEVELLLEEGATPEAYFLERIAESDGRARQKTLVVESGLSESTVSRMLSGMESEGSILRHRIGRENIVCLPGCEPAGFQSTVEERRD